MITVPARPGDREQIDPETERIIRERLATYNEDKKDAKLWEDVKARILEQLKPR